ncbi:General transcription factor IIE subunit 1 [Sparganum proliferum]
MAVMASREVVQNGAAVKRSARALESSDPNEVPACLKKLVRTIVRSFYSREHSLIMDLLVRNTIMKEDDLCERLRFEKKQLRQYLHTLKTDQFIKSKLQLETDADGKTAKIIHYFIDYKLFVNVVKYRLDQMQRRLDAEQRQTTSRALFKCLSCNSSYTDLEVDRLFDFTVGKLVCVYCRADVQEEEDNAQRSDARALVAKFHQQVREPLDDMLKECDRVHLSSSVLEPEIRALEPLPGQSASDTTNQNVSNFDKGSWANDGKRGASALTPVESTVTIVLGGEQNSSASVPKERPVWMLESTINTGLGAGLGELDRGGGTASAADSAGSSANVDPITQTLAPGRVPTALHSTPDSTDNTSTAGSGSSQQTAGSSAASNIMQLLIVHERRGLGSHGPKSAQNRTSSTPTNAKTSSSSSVGANLAKNGQSTASGGETGKRDDTKSASGVGSLSSTSSAGGPADYTVTVNGKQMSYTEVTPAMVKTMTSEERSEYIRVGKRYHSDLVFD